MTVCVGGGMGHWKVGGRQNNVINVTLNHFLWVNGLSIMQKYDNGRGIEQSGGGEWNNQDGIK